MTTIRIDPDRMRQPQTRSATGEALAVILADRLVINSLAARFTCTDVETVADFCAAHGNYEAAREWIRGHELTDKPHHRHYQPNPNH